MILLLTTVLFAGSALLALGAVAASVSRYGSTALALPGQLRECRQVQEVHVRTVRMEVRRTSAKIYRPDFKRKLRELSPQPPLRDAA
jgi:hypothetical protein